MALFSPIRAILLGCMLVLISLPYLGHIHLLNTSIETASAQQADGLSGQILLLTPNRFYLRPLDSSASHAFPAQASDTLFFIAPDRTKAFYKTTPQNLAVIDFPTLEVLEVSIPARGLMFAQWSPDSEWLATIHITAELTEEERQAVREGDMVTTTNPTFTLFVFHLPTQTMHEVTNVDNEAHWLVDNSLIYLTEGYSTVQRIDPVTGEITPVDVPVSTVDFARGLDDPSYRRSTQQTLHAHNLALTNDYLPNISPQGDAYAEVSAPVTGHKDCRDFVIVRKPLATAVLPETLYKAPSESVVAIGTPLWLGDGGLLFAMRHAPNCETESAVVSVYLLRDGQLTAMAEAIASQATPGFAVGPDENYLAWLAADGQSSPQTIVQIASLDHTEGVTTLQLDIASPASSIHWVR